MTQFLTRYFVQEISAWIVFTPLGVSLTLLIGAFSGQPMYFIMMFVVFSCVVVFTKYNEVRKNYSKMFALFPLRIGELLNADVAFLSLITFCYSTFSILSTIILTLLVNNEFIFPSMDQLLQLVGCCFLLIAINLLFIWFNSPSISPIIIVFIFSFDWRFITHLSFFSKYLSYHFLLQFFDVLLPCCIFPFKKRGATIIMMNLLRFHFYFSRKTLLFLPFFIFLFFFIHTNTILDMLIPFIYLSVSIPFICISHLLHEKFCYNIRLLPISTKDLVQSTFLYVSIICLIIYIPIFSIICYQYIQGQAEFFQLSFMLGLLSYSVIAPGGMVASYFKEPTKFNKSKPTEDIVFYLLFVSIAQTFISALFHYVFHLDMIGVLITPMICLFIFYKDYQRSIRHYENAEFL